MHTKTTDDLQGQYVCVLKHVCQKYTQLHIALIYCRSADIGARERDRIRDRRIPDMAIKRTNEVPASFWTALFLDIIL